MIRRNPFFWKKKQKKETSFKKEIMRFLLPIFEILEFVAIFIKLDTREWNLLVFEFSQFKKVLI